MGEAAERVNVELIAERELFPDVFPVGANEG